ncbi:hypothetical protein IV102_10305 [bacterium]|nr:hypothetical protein [bacterium]
MKRKLSLLVLLALAGGTDPLSWSSLRRQPGPETLRLNALLKVLPDKVKGPDWKHIPLRVGGNFISETWMHGPGRVLNQHFMESPGAGWIQLETLHYKLPDTFGLILSVGDNPPHDGIGVRFWYSSGGKPIVSEAADLSFQNWKSATPGPMIPILRYPVKISEDYQAPPHWLTDLPMARLDKIDSAAQLKALALQGYARIVPAFRKALEAGQVKRKVYGRYEGKGIPPAVMLVDISPAESQQLLHQVEQQVQTWTEAVQQNSPAYYAAYRRVVPWPPQ